MSARRVPLIILIIAFLAIVTGCEGVVPELDLQQMNDQYKVQPYEATTLFPDGRGMQPPPPGTIAHDRVLGQPALVSGVAGGAYVDRIPLPPTRELLATGRFAYETYCAACHGLDGSGRSAVAHDMELRKPPPLTREPVRSFPAGRVFQVATEGYGLMPSYALELSTRERWAVVAWLRALQLSQSVSLDALPPRLRSDAERALASPQKGYVDPEAQ
ncbi:MAG TPA: cytochrome c [Polyangia bacterium]|jgi:mono/diheme cytochrome c family protein|nr:cytochrome c [Polyangia bacterium]